MRPGYAYVGTAGWSIPAIHAAAFPAKGSHLERYAQRLNAVEINSSFYRPHRRATYVRWAASVPEDFRFAVKMPRSVSHDAKLVDCEAPLARFLDEIQGLDRKLGVILVQLPPSAGYDADVASRFFALVRRGSDAPLALEPRHATWFSKTAETQLEELRVARVAADPPRAEEDGTPGGWRGLAYYRWHGAPRIYYSNYGADALARLRRQIEAQQKAGHAAWCIFDNTAAFAATANALSLAQDLGHN